MSYPVVLNVKDKVCLVVGGGKVGSRKARGLHAEGAQVTVISSSFYETIDGVTYVNARYDKRFLDEIRPWLVITATDDRATNAQIQADAQDAIVIRADDSKAGDAHGLMKREMGSITLTASSGVPTFSRYLLDVLTQQITPRWVELAAELQEIRTELKQRLATSEERTQVWKAIEEHYEAWLADDAVDIREEIDSIVNSRTS